VTDLGLNAVEETMGLLADASLGKAVRLDVTSDEDISQFVQACEKRPVEVLVNNAGLQLVSPVEAFPEEKWGQIVDVMLQGAFRMIQGVLPMMKERGFGRIVNIGSVHSLVASPYKSAYVAAKHGLAGLGKTVALETAELDITVNEICPAYVRTPLVDKQITDQAAAHGISEDEVIDKIMLAPMPKKAFITVEEIAAAVEFLMGPAARNITGQSIVIDGGWTAR
jgi:3-hydroxybutyrate dehydrogenase